MRTVKFKREGAKLVFAGRGKREITSETLTIELYDSLVKRNPNYKKLFLVTGDEEVKEVKESKKKVVKTEVQE